MDLIIRRIIGKEWKNKSKISIGLLNVLLNNILIFSLKCGSGENGANPNIIEKKTK